LRLGFSQPDVIYDVDRCTADKDKAVFFILSLLTDKHAYFRDILQQDQYDLIPQAKCCNGNKVLEAVISTDEEAIFCQLFRKVVSSHGREQDKKALKQLLS